MALLFVALAAGVIAGFVSGGRPSNVSKRTIVGTGALVAAIVIQLVPWLVDASPRTGLVCLVASYGLLSAFALVNIRLIRMPVLPRGLLLNFPVIPIDSRMP